MCCYDYLCWIEDVQNQRDTCFCFGCEVMRRCLKRIIPGCLSCMLYADCWLLIADCWLLCCVRHACCVLEAACAAAALLICGETHEGRLDVIHVHCCCSGWIDTSCKVCTNNKSTQQSHITYIHHNLQRASRSTTQYYTVLRSTTQHHAAPRSTTQHHAAPHSTSQHHAEPHSITKHHATSRSITQLTAHITSYSFIF